MKAASSLMAITDRPDIVFTHGQGSWLTDSTGRRHLDFVQGWAVNCLGHCPPALVAALAEQAARLINPSPAFYNQPAMDLADLLTAHSSLDRVFFANTGAEANEGAIKLARKWGALRKNGAFDIITMENGFHGRTLATMSASGKAAWKGLFEPRVPGFPKVPINDLAAVRRAANPNTVAVLLEPIQGEAGVIPAEDDFLRDLRAFTRDNDLLLMVDEVQTGMGRTGLLFGHQHADVEPDVMTLGKGIGGGAPLAALLAREEVCCFAPGDQGGTYNGNPLMTAAGLAVMKEILAPGFLDAVAEKGRALTAALDRLSTRLGLGAVRGRGLLLALDLGRDIADRVVTEARNRGLLVNAPRPATLRFMPALNVSAEEIAAMLDILEQSLKTVLAGDANA